MISLKDIEEAQKNISSYIYKTPQIDSIPLSKVNQKVSLKLESIQITGSFKLRGAINIMRKETKVFSGHRVSS